jgi:hypothetical protein
MEKMTLVLEARSKPIFEKRDAIINGEVTNFADSVKKFDNLMPMLES